MSNLLDTLLSLLADHNQTERELRGSGMFGFSSPLKWVLGRRVVAERHRGQCGLPLPQLDGPDAGCAPYLTAVISAMIDSAISAGWRPPRGRPIGP